MIPADVRANVKQLKINNWWLYLTNVYNRYPQLEIQYKQDVNFLI